MAGLEREGLGGRKADQTVEMARGRLGGLGGGGGSQARSGGCIAAAKIGEKEVMAAMGGAR